MMDNRRQKKPTDKFEVELPAGVKLLRTLEGHEGTVRTVTFDRLSGTLASGSHDGTVQLWEIPSGRLLRTIKSDQPVASLAFDPMGKTLAIGSYSNSVSLYDSQSCTLLRKQEVHKYSVYSLAFDQVSGTLATGGGDGTIKLWDAESGKLLRMMQGSEGGVWSIAFSPDGSTLASSHNDATLRLWDAHTGALVRTQMGHFVVVYAVAFDPLGRTLASTSVDRTVKLWEAGAGRLLRTLEGHTDTIDIIAFSPDGRILASKSADQTIRLWDCETWQTIAIIPEPTSEILSVLAFHPTLPLLAATAIDSSNPERRYSRLIHVWELDYTVLLKPITGEVITRPAVHHTTGKVVLLGDHSVGKSALGHRLIHGRFEKQESTHGQQFWVFPALGKRRADGTECEAILWDFAGQPDYRLVHALFIDNADLALVLFDASDLREPLHGVGFWIKQLQMGQSRCPIILVAAQTDRGNSSLTEEELKAFCQKQGLVGPIVTSSATGVGVEELLESMKSLIPWDNKPAIVTTTTFKRIKAYILNLKERELHSETIVTPQELRARLETMDSNWRFTDDEMLTALGHLENYGYVKRLRTSKGEQRILLQPERLNNLASSFVLEARRNPKGLGALEEKQLLAGGYDFPELKDLRHPEQDVLLDSAALLFLEHNVCFRETDPLRMEPYLVFPELINLKKPLDDDAATEEGVAYTVSGPTENVFASLVVLLGYTHTFTRTAQWRDNARYEMAESLVCGFRQEAERDGELDFVLRFGPTVGLSVRTLFQGLFESFLARRNLTVRRYDPVRCSKSHLLNRTVVREALQQGDETTFCSKCGERLKLPMMVEPIQLTREVQAEVEIQRRAAEERTRFEQAIFRVSAYVTEQKIPQPTCFISYAWGEPEHERWVEKRLATDLQKAGIDVLLDRWHNAQIGASVARFVERIEECERIVVVGTPLYRQKAKNAVSARGSVLAAEYDVAGIRLLATEDEKRTILPVLLAGDESESFPALLRGRVYGDFRTEEEYFKTAFDLILSVYQLPPTHPAVADLRELFDGTG
jgi:GTPase SAR1 family protein